MFRVKIESSVQKGWSASVGRPDLLDDAKLLAIRTFRDHPDKIISVYAEDGSRVFCLRPEYPSA